MLGLQMGLRRFEQRFPIVYYFPICEVVRKKRFMSRGSTHKSISHVGAYVKHYIYRKGAKGVFTTMDMLGSFQGSIWRNS